MVIGYLMDNKIGEYLPCFLNLNEIDNAEYNTEYYSGTP